MKYLIAGIIAVLLALVPLAIKADTGLNCSYATVTTNPDGSVHVHCGALPTSSPTPLSTATLKPATPTPSPIFINLAPKLPYPTTVPSSAALQPVNASWMAAIQFASPPPTKGEILSYNMNGGYALEVENNLQIGAWTASSADVLFAANSITLNKPYFIAATQNNSTLSVYLCPLPIGSCVGPTTFAVAGGLTYPATTNYGLTIGGRVGDTTRNVSNASIWNVKVFNYPLTLAQIQAEASNVIANPNAPTPSPTPSPSPSPKPTPTVVPTPTVKPTVAPTPTIAPTVAPTPTIKPTVAPTPTIAPTVVPTPTPMPSVSATPAPTPSPGNVYPIIFNNAPQPSLVTVELEVVCKSTNTISPIIFNYTNSFKLDAGQCNGLNSVAGQTLDFNTTNNNATVFASTGLVVGQTYFLAGVADGTNNWIYVCPMGGTCTATSTPSLGNLTYNDNSFVIGGTASGTNIFPGDIWNLSLWNFARTAAQIQIDANGSTKDPYATPTPVPTPTITPSPTPVPTVAPSPTVAPTTAPTPSPAPTATPQQSVCFYMPGGVPTIASCTAGPGTSPSPAACFNIDANGQPHLDPCPGTTPFPTPSPSSQTTKKKSNLHRYIAPSQNGSEIRINP